MLTRATLCAGRILLCEDKERRHKHPEEYLWMFLSGRNVGPGV